MTFVKCSVITNNCFDSTVFTTWEESCSVAKETWAVYNLVFGLSVVSMFSTVQKKGWSPKWVSIKEREEGSFLENFFDVFS